MVLHLLERVYLGATIIGTEDLVFFQNGGKQKTKVNFNLSNERLPMFMERPITQVPPKLL